MDDCLLRYCTDDSTLRPPNRVTVLFYFSCTRLWSCIVYRAPRSGTAIRPTNKGKYHDRQNHVRHVFQRKLKMGRVLPSVPYSNACTQRHSNETTTTTDNTRAHTTHVPWQVMSASEYAGRQAGNHSCFQRLSRSYDDPHATLRSCCVS